MRIVLLTQDDPFFLGENIDYLLGILPGHSEVVGCVLFDVNPFGKKTTIGQQALDAYKTFGARFFLRYGLKFVASKLNKRKQVRAVLAKHGIPLIELDKSVNHEQSILAIKRFSPDLLVSIGGNQIFKQPVIDLAPKGCLNLHTALLPKYRGLMPSFWVLKNGEAETGVSVFFVDEGIDSGPILVQHRVSIGGRTQEQLIRDTKKLGMEAIAEAADKIHNGGYDLIPNPDEDMTYFSEPQREDVLAFLRAGKRFF